MMEIVKDNQNESSVYVIAKSTNADDSILSLNYNIPYTKVNYFAALIYLMYLRCNKTEETKNMVSSLEAIENNIKITFEIKFLKKDGKITDERLKSLRDYLLSPDKQIFLFNDSYLTRLKLRIAAEIQKNRNNKKIYISNIAKESIINQEIGLPGMYTKEFAKQLDKINSKNLFVFYSDVLKSAGLKLYFVGNITENVIQSIKLNFKGGFRTYKNNNEYEFEIIKKLNVEKSKVPDHILMVYKIKDFDENDMPGIVTMCKLLNVRLENYLRVSNNYVYYANVKFDLDRHALYIISNVIDLDSIKIVKNLITQEVKKLVKKDAVSQEEITNAKDNSFKKIINRTNDIDLDLELIKQMDRLNYDKLVISNLIKQYMSLDSNSIMQVAKKLQLVISYFI